MAWYNGSWSYRKKITVDNTKVAADADNFPVYLDLSQLGSDFHSNVDSAGADIRITKSDGSTEVPIEVVAIDTGAETGEVHFKASGTGGISGSTDTDFYVYYGNAGASGYAVGATYGRNNVWTDYWAVLHLEESSGSPVDATGNSNGGSYYGNLPTQTTGELTNGQDFDGTGDLIQMSTYTNSNITISQWANNDFTTNDADYTLFEVGEATGDNNFFVQWDDGQNDIWTGLKDTNGDNFIHTWGIGFNISGWNHYVTLYNGTNVKSYYNATNKVDNAPGAGLNPSNWNELYIGTRGQAGGTSGNDEYDGQMDEVRVYNGELTSNWISTEYNNQNSPSTFYTIGSQETGSTTYTQTVQAKARIEQADQESTIQAKGRIKQTDQSSTVQAKARIKDTGVGQTVQAKGRIEKEDRVKTIQTKARMEKAGQLSTIQAKARVEKEDRSKTVQAKADIKQPNQVSTVQAKARIVSISETETVRAKGRVEQAGQVSTVQAKAAVKQLGQSSSVSAKARLVDEKLKTVQAKGRVKQTDQSSTSQAKARIEKAGQSSIIQAKARLVDIRSKSVSSRARIEKEDKIKTVQARATVKQLGQSSTVQAKGRIEKEDKAKTVQAKARIKDLGLIKTIQSKARILKERVKTIQAKASIWGQESGYVNMRSMDQTNIKTLWGLESEYVNMRSMDQTNVKTLSDNRIL